MSPRSLSFATALVAGLAVLTVYRGAIGAHFFNDDFHWLIEGFRLDPSYLWQIDRHSHFYRPLIALYFNLGRRVFGCEPAPFHFASLVVHLLTTAAVYGLAHRLARRQVFGVVTALLFAVQPGFVEAVVWIGAITDLMPALFYVLTLLLHLRVVEGAGRWMWAATIASFAACLLTHESSATLLPMMVVLEMFLTQQKRVGATRASNRDRLVRYAPFGVLLTGYLAIEYVVNSRNYVVQDGYYAVGWHVAQNALRYVRWLIVWRPGLASLVTISGLAGLLAAFGSARVRLAVVWMAVTMAPVLFFTWGTASRYLYLPAVGFCLLQTEGLLALHGLLAARINRRSAAAVAGLLVAVLCVRGGLIAQRSVAEFRARTVPYARFMTEVRERYPQRPADGVARLDGMNVGDIPPIYVESAVQVAFCDASVAVIPP